MAADSATDFALPPQEHPKIAVGGQVFGPADPLDGPTAAAEFAGQPGEFL